MSYQLGGDLILPGRWANLTVCVDVSWDPVAESKDGSITIDVSRLFKTTVLPLIRATASGSSAYYVITVAGCLLDYLRLYPTIIVSLTAPMADGVLIPVGHTTVTASTNVELVSVGLDVEVDELEGDWVLT